MPEAILITPLAFFITLISIPAIIRVAREKKLFDLPDERKLHKKSIASLGGVGIFIGLMSSLLLTVNFRQNPEFQYIIAAGLVIFFLGLKDDILILSANKKFIGQLVASAILIHLADVRITSMHGFMGIHDLAPYVSIPVTYLTMIVVINAFNLIDGVDGLAGSLALLTSITLGGYFLQANMSGYAMLAFGLAASCLAFLVFNYNPARIFMGDSGSLMIGMMASVMVIKFITAAGDHATGAHIPSAVAIGFSVLIVPLLDTLRVFSIRLAKGKSPFSPDRNHIHHLLLDRGLNHRMTTFTCVAINAAFILMAFAGKSWGPTALIAVLVTGFYLMIGTLILVRKPVATTIMVSTAFSTQEPVQQQPQAKMINLQQEEMAS